MTLDKKNSRPLAEQMFELLCNDIKVGKYRPGDILPSLEVLAADSDVSVNVSRRALAKLAAAGLVEPKRGVGSCVTNRRIDENSLGRILCLAPFGQSGLYYDWLAFSLRQQLVKRGYLLELAAIASNRACQVAIENLLQHDWDLVLLWDIPHIRRLVTAAKVRFIIIGDDPCVDNEPNCQGVVSIKNGQAFPDLIRVCISKRIKDIVQFRFDNDQYDITTSLKIADIKANTITLPQPNTPKSCMRTGFDAVSQFLERMSKLPDLIYIADDYLAQGGLLALSQKGLRIPEEICVVTHANKGIGPFWVKPLSRIETDPTEHGRALAKAILGYFRNSTFPSPLKLGSVWRKGKTL